MKIALVRRRYSPTGGAEHYLRGLMAGLAEAGHDITLWCEAWPEAKTAGANVRTVATAHPVAFAEAIAQERLMESYDLVFSLERVKQCHLYRAGDGLHRVWLERRAQYAPVRGRLRNWLNPKNQALCALENTLLQRENVQRIIANSTMVQSEIVKHFEFSPQQVPVIPNGVDFDYFSGGNRASARRVLGFQPEDVVVLLVGAGAERKGHRYLAEAMRRWNSPRGKMLIVDRPLPVSMPDVYAAADVFVLPTLYDPFANVTLEALAAGLPVITTPHNGAAEILSEGVNGFILSRADAVEELAAQLRDLADPTRRSALRIPAQALARQYSRERNLTATLEVCAQLR